MTTTVEIFDNLWICTSGFSKELKNEIRRLVESNGGTFEEDLTDKSTHLVINCAGSAKHLAAQKYKINVVLIDWLYASCESKARQQEEIYKLPLFYGLTFCTTGLYADQRDELVDLISRFGGKFQPDLEYGSTTHLIAESSEGMKCEAAFQWGVSVIRPEWVLMCSTQQVYIEEERFLVKDFVEKEDCPTQFQDCIFYLHEIDSKIEVDIVKRIRNLMGTRLLHFSEFITHVVTHNIDSRTLEHFMSESPTVKVIGVEKLLPSFSIKPTPVSVINSSHAETSPIQLETDLKKTEGLEQKLLKKETRLQRTCSSQVNVCKNAHFLLVSDGSNSSLESLIQENAGSCTVCTTRCLNDIARDSDNEGPGSFHDIFSRNCSRIVISIGTAVARELIRALKRKYPDTRVGTELWIRCCLRDGRSYSRSSHMYFSEKNLMPNITQDTRSAFSKMITSVSAYCGAERAMCCELLGLLGSCFTKKLTRKNTHLVCKGSDGPKYRKALEWGLRIVTIEWLLDCAEKGAYIDPQKYKDMNILRASYQGHMTQLENLVTELDGQSFSVPEIASSSRMGAGMKDPLGELKTVVDREFLSSRYEKKKHPINSNFFREAENTQVESQVITYEERP